MMYLDAGNIRVLAADLGYPEGPIACADGSILLVEIRNECLTRIRADGSREIVAHIPGGPNGAAIAPGRDGGHRILVCNDGGFEWIPFPPPPDPPPADYKPSLWISGLQPAGYKGGRLQAVDPATGEVTDLFTETARKACWPPASASAPQWDPPFPLRGPDDLVLDRDGGVWFTDFGKQRPRDRDVTAVYYMAPDGSSLRQAIYPLDAPNGIGLSPDGRWLYVALSYERKLLKYEVGPDGTFKPNARTLDGSYLVTAAFPGSSVLDSLALDEQGNIYVATMVPSGNDPGVSGGITVVSPQGDILDFVEIRLPGKMPEPLPSNICFGGQDMKTAFITCGGTGHLIAMPAGIAGLRLNFNC